MTRRLICVLGLSAGVTLPAAGQFTGRMDLGLGDAPLTHHGQASMWSVGSAFRFDHDRVRLTGAGEYLDFGDLGHSATGYGSASWFVPLSPRLRLELGADARAQGGVRVAERAAWSAGPRLHLATTDRGLWAGSRAGSDAVGVTFQWEAAAWRRWGPISFQLLGKQTVQSVRVTTTGLIDTLTPPDTLPRTESRLLTDLGSWLGWHGRRVEVLAAGGVRLGLAQPGVSPPAPGDGGALASRRSRSHAEGWWQAELAFWVTDWLAIAGTVGRQPGDPSLLAPAGRFLRMSFRASLGGPARPAVRPAPPPGGLRSVRKDGPEVEFLLAAAGAGRVELMGDFTDWAPVSMDAEGDGRWRLRLSVAPGLYRVNVRYDGGPWQVPPGTRAVSDEFGVVSGVLLVS